MQFRHSREEKQVTLKIASVGSAFRFPASFRSPILTLLLRRRKCYRISLYEFRPTSRMCFIFVFNGLFWAIKRPSIRRKFNKMVKNMFWQMWSRGEEYMCICTCINCIGFIYIKKKKKKQRYSSLLLFTWNSHFVVSKNQYFSKTDIYISYFAFTKQKLTSRI